MKALHGKRVEVCLDLISKALRGEIGSRDELIRELERAYARLNIEPIRGRSKINIYEKEMCTVYVVAKYGVGLDPNEYRDFYDKYLYVELKAEKAAERLRAGEGERAIIEEMGSADEDAVFRVARLEATAVLLGFKSDDDLAALLEAIEKAFPNLVQKINGFKKFFIAFKVAQALLSGNVTNRLEKEALKHALCIKFNAVKAAPSDEFIREIAVNVLGASERLVSNALTLKQQRLPSKVGD